MIFIHFRILIQRISLAIIVDKVQKRKDIAMACTDLILEKGLKKLTVAEVAKTAKIATGSVYNYFSHKEDIVFEVIRNILQEYNDDLMTQINEKKTTREKVFLLFDFVFNEDGKFDKKHNFYKEYIGIQLFNEENQEMLQFNKECSLFLKGLLEKFIKEGIEKKELVSNSIHFIAGLNAIEKGFLFLQWTQEEDVRDDFKIFLNNLFDLIELKEEIK